MTKSTVKPDSNAVPHKDISSTWYANRSQKLMQVANALRSTGVAVDVDLPTIAVAGNQSSGKSSLIEALSSVKLPRATGTCTRVPIEVRLRREEYGVWQCNVKIRRESDNANGHTGTKPERFFGSTLSDPDDVLQRVRQAQLRVLHSGLGITDDEFLAYEGESNSVFKNYAHVEFSRDVIVLEISGPDLTDLTVVDLPGLISNSDDPNDILLVDDLVTSYISKDCLILLVIPMHDDYQNSKAVRLAREADPTGDRTIGVLTKADTVHGSENEQWVKAVQGHQTDKSKLKLGYYVTRQPTNDELISGIDFAQARANEKTFFETTKPWSSMDLSLQSRLGTKNLTAFLSDKLLAFIKEKLPALQKDIKAKAAQTQEGIRALGDPPSEDGQRQLLDMISRLSQAIHSHARGEVEHEAFMQGVNRVHEDYKRTIRGTAPRFIPLSKDELDHAEPDRGTSKESEDADSLVVEDIEEFAEGDLGQSGGSFEVMDLTEVHRYIKQSRTRELPNEVPVQVKARLIKHFLSTWGEHTDNLLDQTIPLLERAVHKEVKTVFGKYEEGMLRAAVSDIVEQKIAQLAESTRVQLQKLIALDSEPFTLNDHYLNDLSTKVFAQLKAKRRTEMDQSSLPADAAEARPQIVRDILAGYNKLGVDGLKEADLDKVLPVAEFERELKLMADTRAYWQVAYKRIIDNAPRGVDHEFVRPASKTIQEALVGDLKITDADDKGKDGRERCKEYLAESPDVMRRRDELENKRARLADAQAALRSFHQAP